MGEHERCHKELSDGIRILNGRLGELTERKNLTRTRQSRAEAAHGMASTTGPIGDLEDVFERWEAPVAQWIAPSPAAAFLLVAGSAAVHALLLVPDRSALRTKPRTLETGLAVSSLATPAVVIAARQVLFYDVSTAFWGIVFSTAALGGFGFALVGLTAWLERRARAVKVSHEVVGGLPQ